MAFERARVVRTSQPQDICGVDRSNPLAPKSGLWLPGVSNRNYVTDKLFSLGGSGATPEDTETVGGRALYTSGKYLQSDLPASAFSVLTWCAVITPDAGPTGSNYSNLFQTTQTTFNWNHANAAYRGAFSLYGGGAYPTCKFTNGFVAGRREILHGTYIGTTLSVYRNGVLENSVTAANGLPTVTPLEFMGGRGGTAVWPGSCEYFYWDTTKALTAKQIEEHADNLFQVFEPESRWVFVSDDAGSGGVTQVIGDLAASYDIRAAATSDLSAAYAVRGAIAGDLGAAYDIRAAAAQDLDASYLVRGASVADLAGTYDIRGAVSADAAAIHQILGAVNADLAASYDIQGAGTVASDLACSYLICGAVAADLEASYLLRGLVSTDFLESYDIRSAVSADLVASYAVDGALSAVFADLTCSYTIDGLAAACPTAAEIAAAVITAAQASPLHADVRAIRGLAIVGSGQVGDEFGVA